MWWKIILVVVCVIVVAFLLELGGLQWMKFFGPRKEEVRRNVFEETKSFTQGKTADLANYYEEYSKAESSDDKEAIRQLVIMNFAEFKSSSVNNFQLRVWLVQMRGY